jgi:hypothetical protein
MWKAGVRGRRAGEVECVLVSDGRMKCAIPAELRGRDGSRPRARCLFEVASQLDGYTDEAFRRLTYPDNSCVFLKDRGSGFQTVIMLERRRVWLVLSDIDIRYSRLSRAGRTPKLCHSATLKATSKGIVEFRDVCIRIAWRLVVV